jgi:hypothetical protein
MVNVQRDILRYFADSSIRAIHILPVLPYVATACITSVFRENRMDEQA